MSKSSKIIMRLLSKYVFLVIAILVMVESVIKAQDESLVLFLSFDEGKGKVAKDFSQYQHEGIIEGNPKWVDGKFKKALDFAGPDSGQYVEVPHSEKLDVDYVTAMAWIYSKEWANNRHFWGKSVHGGCSGRAQHGFFGQTANLRARFETEGGRFDVDAPLPPLKEWVHVAVTFDGTIGEVYVNGESVADGKTGKTVLKKTTDSLYIAADCDRMNYIFNGIIDEVRMWNRALSKKEIAASMQKGAKEFLAVHPFATLKGKPERKLATTWGTVKQSF